MKYECMTLQFYSRHWPLGHHVVLNFRKVLNPTFTEIFTFQSWKIQDEIQESFKLNGEFSCKGTDSHSTVGRSYTYTASTKPFNNVMQSNRRSLHPLRAWVRRTSRHSSCRHPPQALLPLNPHLPRRNLWLQHLRSSHLPPGSVRRRSAGGKSWPGRRCL